MQDIAPISPISIKAGSRRMKVSFFGAFQNMTGMSECRHKAAAPISLRDLIAALDTRFPGLASHILDADTGRVLPGVLVLRDGRAVPDSPTDPMFLPDCDVVIMHAISGGANPVRIENNLRRGESVYA